MYWGSSASSRLLTWAGVILSLIKACIYAWSEVPHAVVLGQDEVHVVGIRLPGVAVAALFLLNGEEAVIVAGQLSVGGCCGDGDKRLGIVVMAASSGGGGDLLFLVAWPVCALRCSWFTPAPWLCIGVLVHAASILA